MEECPRLENYFIKCNIKEYFDLDNNPQRTAGDFHCQKGGG